MWDGFDKKEFHQTFNSRLLLTVVLLLTHGPLSWLFKPDLGRGAMAGSESKNIGQTFLNEMLTAVF